MVRALLQLFLIACVAYRFGQIFRPSKCTDTLRNLMGDSNSALIAREIHDTF